MGLGPRDEIEGLLAEFYDALTGGSFGEKVRAEDLVRSKLVYATAGDVVARVRGVRFTPEPRYVALGLFIMLPMFWVLFKFLVGK